MKRYLVVALAAFGLALVAPRVSARIVFDPPTTGGSRTGMAPALHLMTLAATSAYTCDESHNDPCNVADAGQTYQVAYVDCASVLPRDRVGDVEDAYPGFHAVSCLWLNQVSNSPVLNTFKFALTPTAGLGDPVDCVPYPTDAAIRSNCPEQTTDGIYTATFFTPVPQGVNFYLFTDFATTGTADVTAFFVPEPGQLGLFGLGLLVIGVGLNWRKRHHRE